MAVRFHNDGINYNLPHKNRHKDWIIRCITDLGKTTGSINFIFTSGSRIIRMNREYLNHNYPTDVITFGYTDGSELSGDIFISVDQVHENAALYKVGDLEEMRRVMVHGVLHLAGLDDSTASEKNKMRKMENDALNLWSQLNGNHAGI